MLSGAAEVPRVGSCLLPPPFPNMGHMRLGALLASGSGDILADDGLANRRKRDAGQFQMLDAKRNADDGDEAQQGRTDMTERQPQAGKDEPNDVAKQPEAAGADILLVGQLMPADGLFSKRKEGELADHKAGLAPGDADNRDERNQTGEPPAQAHDKAAQNEPQKIADSAHFLSS